MPDYRRCYRPGGTFFFTIVTHQRRPLFADAANVERLRAAVRDVRSERAFDIVGAVVLPDHLHFLWSLPEGDVDYSRRIGRMKVLFTRSFQAVDHSGATSASRERRRESGVWQRRFWEHTIRDEADLQAHLDYIHYNPVRHGLVACAHLWRFSSFERWVNRGGYAADWCCSCGGQKVSMPYPEKLGAAVGE